MDANDKNSKIQENWKAILDDQALLPEESINIKKKEGRRSFSEPLPTFKSKIDIEETDSEDEQNEDAKLAGGQDSEQIRKAVASMQEDILAKNRANKDSKNIRNAIANMEEDVLSKTNTHNDSKNIRQAVANIEKDVLSKATGRNDSKDIRKAVANMEKDGLFQTDGHNDTQHIRKAIEDSLSRKNSQKVSEQMREAMSNMDEDLRSKGSAQKDADHIRKAARNMEQDILSKSNARKDSEQIRGAVSNMEEDMLSKSIAQKDSDHMRKAARRMEEDVVSKCNAHKDSEQLRKAVGNVEQDVLLKTRSREDSNRIMNSFNRSEGQEIPAPTPLLLRRLEADLNTKADAQADAQNFKDSVTRKDEKTPALTTISKIQRLQNDLEAKASARADSKNIQNLTSNVDPIDKTVLGGDQISDRLRSIEADLHSKANVPLDSQHILNAVVKDNGDTPASDPDTIRKHEINGTGSSAHQALRQIEQGLNSKANFMEISTLQHIERDVNSATQASQTEASNQSDGQGSNLDYDPEDDLAMPTGAFSIAASGAVSVRTTGALSDHPNISSQGHAASSPNREFESATDCQSAEVSTTEGSTAISGAASHQTSSLGIPEQRVPHDGQHVIHVAAGDVPHNTDMNTMGQEVAEIKDETPTSCLSTRSAILLCLVLLVSIVVTVIIVMLGGGEKTGSNTSSTSAPSNGNTYPVESERVQLVRDILKNFVLFPESLDDRASPQYSALVWVADEDSLSPIDSVSAVGSAFDKLLVRYGLAVFYFALGGGSWFSSEGWLETEEEECNWEFISCNNESSVVAIDSLGNPNNIRGQVPSELQLIPSLRKYIAVSCSFLLDL